MSVISLQVDLALADMQVLFDACRDTLLAGSTFDSDVYSAMLREMAYDRVFRVCNTMTFQGLTMHSIARRYAAMNEATVCLTRMEWLRCPTVAVPPPSPLI